MKQVALQISLKRNLIECALLLCIGEADECLEAFGVGGRHASAD